MMSQSYSQKILMFTPQENTKTRRSKLEVYIDILKELSQRQLRLTHIMQKANINGNKNTQQKQSLLRNKHRRNHSTKILQRTRKSAPNRNRKQTPLLITAEAAFGSAKIVGKVNNYPARKCQPNTSVLSPE
jgi:predicted transcriptional regulator